MESRPPSKFRNIFSATPTKTLYTNLKIDATAPTKLKCNELFFSVPFGTGNIGIFPISRASVVETVKIEVNPPLLLAHGKQIQDFEHSPLEPTILASSTRVDGLVRLWKLPTDLTPTPLVHAPAREIDAAAFYLAAHEKRVDLIKFHPTVGNILTTASADSTIRLWEIEGMQDRICLTCPNDAVAQSITFDYCGDTIAVGATDGMVHLYDPRASTDPVQSISSNHTPAKGLRACWLPPDPVFITTGFAKTGGGREVAIWDAANLAHPVKVLPVEGTGVSILQPFWDPALPLLYFGSKGEGIRVYELAEGNLRSIAMVKIDKHASCVDLLPKSLCVTPKCEISRFLRLGTDNSIDTTSIYVPRVNAEKVFQHDLYPPVAIIDPQGSADRWFETLESIELLMVDVNVPVEAPIPTQDQAMSPTSAEIERVLMPKETPPTIEDLILQRSSTMKQRSGVLRRTGTISRSSSAASISSLAQGITADAPTHPKPVYLDGFIDIERKGWFGSVWERHYLSLKKARLYVSVDQDSESALYYISMSAVRHVEGFSIGPSAVGFEVETTEGLRYRFKATSISERDHWIDKLKGLTAGAGATGFASSTRSPSMASIVGAAAGPSSAVQGVTKKAALPPLPKPMTTGAPAPTTKIVIGNREGASLLGELIVLTASEPLVKGKLPWVSRLVVLDEEGFLHIYIPDLKAYTQGKPALESMNLSSAISVRISDPAVLMADPPPHLPTLGTNTPKPGLSATAFQISSTKRVTHFRARSPHEAANWVIQIRRIVVARGVLPAAELVTRDCYEGLVNIQTPLPACGPRQAGKHWLAVIDGSFYYFRGPASTTPAGVIPASQFEQVLPADDTLYAFDMRIVGGGVLRHITASPTDRDAWVRELSRVRMESFDLLGKIGIETDQTLRDEIGKAKAEQWGKEVVERVLYVDQNRFVKGEQKLLVGVFGKTRLTFTMVEPIWTSLRSDAAFVLDVGTTIYHWNGTTSSRVARARAMDLATRIRKARSNRPRVLLVEPDDRDLLPVFTRHLTLTVSPTPPVPTMPTDLAALSTLRIFRVVNSLIRRRKLLLVYEGAAPSKGLLETEAVYVAHSAVEILMWVGAKASSEHAAIGLLVLKKLALQMRDAMGKAGFVVVDKMYEGRESPVWKEKFIDYEGSLPISMRAAEERRGNIVTNLVQKPIDVLALFAPPPHLPQPVDSGRSGRLTIYRVENFLRFPVGAKLHGQFFRGESYILLYMYRPPGSGVEKCVSYFWQGSHGTITQKGTSALMTIELSEQTGGDVVQVRVVEGKEPKHLCLLFGEESIVTRLGIPPPADPGSARPIAFDIRETFSGLCKAVECEVSELPFSSDRALAILFPETSYIWQGRTSTGPERAHAARIATRFGAAGARTVIAKEGDPMPAKMSEILRAAGVDLSGLTTSSAKRNEPRLFSCSAGSGIVRVNEVQSFAQEDLDPNVVMILDAGLFIFIWFGLSAKPAEKIIGMETMIAYLEKSKIHDQKTRVVVTYAYQEPAEFTNHFHGWTKKKFPKDKTNLPVRTRPVNEVLKEYKQEIYPLDVLLSDKLPEHVDPTKLEMYLDEEEFTSLFKMKKDEYLGLLAWKKEQVKKEVGIF
ncbi:hypothetical protein BDK51DRAFT_19573 [Blyttiomyces helicus]|uniref:Coronin n=1 Tax=Blyttiomyces helicus TaxID=388810 RepID=A0A4P9WMZ2_9FUNG|nr:hypothetical protein BDK51DRAFT_19573 [Blyttiomyces helicus]|eukprot:RKO93413.1 hypothetical protein BDK51DRAFT_19573 [Blyttiomyces helicus]